MGVFRPSMYRKNIFDINYNRLKEQGVTCLVFDLDNTLGLVSHKKCPRKTKKLLRELQKDFLIIISSNNTKSRIKPYLKDIGVDGVAWSMKPTTRGLRIIKRKYQLVKREMCIIGDQIITDVLCGNRFKIKTILVDPMGDNELKITKINRKFEDFIIKKYEKKGMFERGKYYE